MVISQADYTSFGWDVQVENRQAVMGEGKSIGVFTFISPPEEFYLKNQSFAMYWQDSSCWPA